VLVADLFIGDLPGYFIDQTRAEELSNGRGNSKNMLFELYAAITRYENSKRNSNSAAPIMPSEEALSELGYWIREALSNGIVLKRKDEASDTVAKRF
jgi:hypothetical protein